MLVRDVYFPEFLLCDGEVEVKDIISEIDEVPIIIKTGNKLRVLDERKFITSFLPPETKLKTVSKSVTTLKLQDKIEKAAKGMVENDVDYLPVVEKNIEGVVREIDLLKAVPQLNIAKEKVERIASEAISIDADAPVSKALALMKDYNIGRLPVTEHGELVGIVTRKDILEKLIEPKKRVKLGEKRGRKIKTLKIPVSNFMSPTLITIKEKDTIKNAVKKLTEHNISSLIVTDGKMKILTIKDILELLAFREEDKINIQIVGDYELLDDEDVKLIVKDARRIVKKFPFLGSGYIVIHLKAYKNQYKEKRLWNVRIRLSTENGFYVVHSEGFGALYVFQHALSKLEREIVRSKETKENVYKYLEKMEI